MRWIENKVRPPALLRSDNMHPSLVQVTLFIVWVRYTVLTAEMLNTIDGFPSSTTEEEIHQQVDRFCVGMEGLICEWKLSSIMMDETKSELVRYLVADHVSGNQCNSKLI